MSKSKDLLIFLLFTAFVGLSTAAWGSWGACSPKSGSLDQNCNGVKKRVSDDKEPKTQTSSCILTTAVVNGGYTPWGEWDDCTKTCGLPTTRTRTCNNPTPCNGGDDCSLFGQSELTKTCGPVAGGWGAWEAWQRCQRDGQSTSVYGTGTRNRTRTCDNPIPICGGDYCYGNQDEYGNCRVVPPCLTYEMFSNKFLKITTPMVIYTSAEVDIFLMTKNKCDTSLSVRQYWLLFRVYVTAYNVTEELVQDELWNVKFTFKPNRYELGLYRLYAKIGYNGRSMTHWMEESMYVKIEHPPPHAFIVGGSGRTVGAGTHVLDGKSESYSLTKGPGDPSGLVYDWLCLNFVTRKIYTLLQFNFDPTILFNETVAEGDVKKKWYETSFLPTIENLVAFVETTELYKTILALRENNKVCHTADYFNVSYTMDDVEKGPGPYNYEDIPLTELYPIDYMSDYQKSKVSSKKKNKKWEEEEEEEEVQQYNISVANVEPFPPVETIMLNEYLELMGMLFGTGNSFGDEVDNFYSRLDESTLVMSSIYQLNGLSGLPASAQGSFFPDLEIWLDNVNMSKQYESGFIQLYDSFLGAKSIIERAINLQKFIGTTDFLLLAIDKREMCLLDYLGDLFVGMVTINSIDWFTMQKQELFYMNWMGNDVIQASACPMFSYENGAANLTVTEQNATDGVGYLIYIRVEFEESYSHFLQHVQAINTQPSLLNIECRLNCMKKTALTSMLSLKSSCPSCTYDQLKGARFYWNVRDLDLFSKKSSQNYNWTDWMMTEYDYSTKFVMSANVLTPNSGYIIEALMEDVNGLQSFSLWIVTTNILPRGGECLTEPASWGDKRVKTIGWLDEGFRTALDETVDWKEQLNFRILQVDGSGKEDLLYYGSEEENFIQTKPGRKEDSFNVTIKVQIYDIFQDYAECTIDEGQKTPSYQSTHASISSFMKNAGNAIDYYLKSGNNKKVTMNTEVAGSALDDLTMPPTIFDLDPSNWTDIALENLPDGTVRVKTFEELVEGYDNPDLGDPAAQAEILNKLGNFSDSLKLVTNNLDATSTVKVKQVLISIGSMLKNGKFTNRKVKDRGLDVGAALLEKLINVSNTEAYPKYEDYMQNCEGVLRLMDNLLEAVIPKSSPDEPLVIDMFSVMDDIGKKQRFKNNIDDGLTAIERAFMASRIARRNHLDKEIMNDEAPADVTFILKNMETLRQIMQSLNTRKQLRINASHGKIKSVEDKKSMGELMRSGFQEGGIDISFTEAGYESTEDQNIQATMFDRNPFSWTEESKYILKTTRISVGEENATNTLIPSKINFPNSESPLNTTKTVQVAVPTDASEPTNQIVLYEFYWRSPSDNIVVSIKAPANHLRHTLYIRKEKAPSTDTFDWKKIIEDDDWVQANDIKVIVPGNIYKTEIPVDVYIGLMIDSDLSTNNQTNTTTTRRKRSLSVEQYEIGVVTTGCRVWDDANQRWDNTSCTVSNSSTMTETICECSNPPSNNFATTFYVPPNTIDFGTVFQKFNLKDNAAVFATVVSLIVLYLLICVWAKRQDSKDKEKWNLSYLLDNNPDDEYLYMVTVHTGLHRLAGTKSNVYMTFIDGVQKRNSEEITRHIVDESHEGFGIGSVKRFIMSLPKKMQEPAILRVWHDNSGKGNDSSWYLNKVELVDLQTKEGFLFICNQWLTLDFGNEQTECSIPVSNDEEKHMFSFLFNEKARQSSTENHLWLSVFVRPEHSNFTRLERLACCLALLFLTMISNAMFYGQDTGSRIKLGPISFSLSGIYISLISALIAAPPIMLVSFLYRKSRSKDSDKRIRDIERNKENIFSKSKRSKAASDLKDDSELPLPFWCRYIAWIIVTLAIFASGFFLILYSMEWGKSKSEEWLMCFFLSLFQSICFVDPIKIVIISLIFSCIIKRYDEGQEGLKLDREKVLHETKRKAILLFKETKGKTKMTVKPPSQTKLEKVKRIRKQQLRIQKTFIEMVLYIIFLVMLYLISFSNRDPSWYNIRRVTENHLINPQPLVGSPRSFSQVTKTAEWYEWFKDTIVPFIFPRFSTNGELLNAYQRLFTSDDTQFRLGPMRLRQVRVNPEKCKKEFWKNSTCYGHYNVYEEEDGDFCVGWGLKPCVRGQDVYEMTSPAFEFVSAVDTLGLPVVGQLSTYGGGGYISEFIVNRNISITMANELKKYSWIDRRTRAVFVEFTLYSVDENVFTYFSFLTEFPESGGVINTHSLTPFRPYQHVGGYGIVVLVCEVIVVIGMIIFTVNIGVGIYRNGKKTFKEIWNVIDIVIAICFYVTVVMYIGQCIMVNQAMNKFLEHKMKFVNFSHIVLWNDMLNSTLAIVIFLSTFRLMKVLSYNDRINQFGAVLSHVMNDLTGCFVMFLLIYSAFVFFGYLMFGRYLETYRNLFISSTTLVNAIIGKNSINDLFSVEPVLGRIYYFLFVLFLLWIVMTMMNATLNCGITTVRSKPVPNTYGLTNFMIEVWEGIARAVISSPPTKHGVNEPRQQATESKECDNVNNDVKKKRRARRIYQ